MREEKPKIRVACCVRDPYFQAILLFCVSPKGEFCNEKESSIKFTVFSK
jgi:hypothetical protein